MAEREKRALDSASSSQEGQPDWKRQRPALASVIVEALKVDSLQKLCSSLEPILRRVVTGRRQQFWQLNGGDTAERQCVVVEEGLG